MTKARDIATSSVTTADLTAEVGSTIQAHDADLDTISSLAKTDGNVIVGDGTNWVAEDPATVRTSLGLGTAATTASTDYATAAQGALADSALQSVADGSITEAKLSAGAGSADQILTSNGSGTLTWANAAGGGFSNMDVITSTGTWTNPGSVTKVKVTVVGGGGGGGAKYGGGSLVSAGAGGGGGTAIEVVTIPTSPVPITVGAGGSGYYSTVTGGPENPFVKRGGDGGTSSFGAYCSASGGEGGYAARNDGIVAAWSSARVDASGGVGSGGTINLQGGHGSLARRVADVETRQGGHSSVGFGKVHTEPLSGGYGGGGQAIGWSPSTNNIAYTSASDYNGMAGVVLIGDN